MIQNDFYLHFSTKLIHLPSQSSIIRKIFDIFEYIQQDFPCRRNKTFLKYLTWFVF